MIVWKEKRKFDKNSYTIYVKVGSNIWSSYWSSPSKDISRFDMEYLQGRYPIIRTKKRAEEFSRLYKNLWIDVTPYQLELMQHCIGIGRSKKPYRNYFFTQETDSDWNELVKKGLAVKGTKHPNDDECIYFWLRRQGVEFVLGKSVSYKVYDEL